MMARGRNNSSNTNNNRDSYDNPRTEENQYYLWAAGQSSRNTGDTLPS